MRVALVFGIGILVGAGMQTTVAQTPRPDVRLNHIGLSVADLGAAMQFYQEKFGFTEVARNPNGMGAIIQVSRDTFIELQQANPDRPAGSITHFGFDTPDIKTTVSQLRQRGVTVSDPGAPNRWAGSILAQVNDPVYGRIELAEQPATGPLRVAAEAWKN